jgi:hypothetical protein
MADANRCEAKSGTWVKIEDKDLCELKQRCVALEIRRDYFYEQLSRSRDRIRELEEKLEREKARGDDLDAALEAERDMEISLEIVDKSSLDRLEKKIDEIGFRSFGGFYTQFAQGLEDEE